jgi:hypothetical protein
METFATRTAIVFAFVTREKEFLQLCLTTKPGDELGTKSKKLGTYGCLEPFLI